MVFSAQTTATLLTTAAIAIGLVSCQSSPDQAEQASPLQPGTGTSVQPAYAVLEELFQTEVVNLGLEQLGYTVEPGKQLDYAAMYVDLANGGTDFIADYWKLLHNEFFLNSGGDKVLEPLGVVVSDALQGYRIDQATAEKHGITDIAQLKDPEVAKLFDSDGDGKANLTGCNPGWGCELVIEHHLKAYDLEATVQQDQGEYFALMANTITRYKQGDPILYYTWSPLWLNDVLVLGKDVDWLVVPFTSLPEKQGDVTTAQTTHDGKNLGFAIDEIMTLANRDFANQNPAATKFMTLVSIPIADVSAQNELMQQGQDTAADIRKHAEDWVTQNQTTFDGWIKQALEAEPQQTSTSN
ncbi:MAG: glycine betaine/L-proline ABC transporter substrate-binding protein ProX [Cyanobacteria bacterium P01_H01_bin.121]